MADEVVHSETTTSEQSTPAHGDMPTIAVKVYAPFQVYFEGNAFSVSAVNATGPFDILPRHHNFLCMLVPCSLTIRPVEGEPKTIKIHRALMSVNADRVVVFVDV
jgi:F0F1-type ATP synthase epsilon subunit